MSAARAPRLAGAMKLAATLGLASLALAAATCDPGVDEDAQEVKNGTSGAAHVSRVFYLINPLAAEGAVGASASSVKYKRCLLTAAHVTQGALTRAFLIYRGADLQDLAGKENQNTAAFEVVPGQVVPWRDLAVLWATNFQTAPGGGGGSGSGTGGAPADPRIPLSGWNPYPMIETIGLGNADLTAATQPPAAPSAGAPIGVMVAGYGNNTTAAGADTGDGVLRVGAMNAIHFFDMTAQANFAATTGGFYNLVQTAALQSVCQGDSGGPAGTGAGIFAVISTQNGASCATSTGSYVTALNDDATPGTKSNWDWTHEAIARICGKSITIQILGSGRVDGPISPGQNHIEGNPLSNKIKCSSAGDTDCNEMFHEGQAMTLTATPAAGWRFKRWSHLTPPFRCKCDGSTMPTCAVSYDPMGTYSVTESTDTDGCKAEFELIPPPPPDGGVPDAPTPDGGTPDGGLPDAPPPDAGTTDGPTPDAGPMPDARTDASLADGPGDGATPG